MTRVSLLCLVGALLAPLSLQGQQAGTVSGVVTDAATGSPLAGVSVTVAGTSIGRITDSAGRYAITGIPANAATAEVVIEVRMLGYAQVNRTFTLNVAQPGVQNFSLSTAPVLLEGVVAVGYGTQSRRYLTGSVVSVQADLIRQVPTANAVQAIQGRAAGVDIVRTSGVPGSGMQIRIRGNRSLSGGNDPLFVVDGVPLAGGIGDFNTSNIQDIQILKDASATAVYGSRGANGVVLITTTAATAGATQFTYNSYAGVQRPINLVRMMNCEEYAQYRRHAYWTVNPNYTEEQIFPGALEQAALASGECTDWQRAILRTGVQHDHQFGMAGGNETTRFSLTGGYFDQEGITIAQGFARYTANMSVQHTRNRFTFGANISGTRSSQQTGPGNAVWGAALSNHMLGSPYDENGLLKPKANDDPLLVNPLVTAYENINNNQRNRFFSSFFAEVRPYNWMSLRTTFGPDLTKTTNGSFSSRNARNGSLPSASKSENETFAYTWTNTLNMNRVVGTNHRMEATLVYEVQENESQSSSLAVEDLPYDHQLWHNMATAGLRTNLDSNYSKWALESYMARGQYTLLDRYTLTLTGRYDGSSRLAPDLRWAFFPSASVRWQLGDEAFMQGLGWLSDAGLRASYGVVGNTAINPYQTQGTLTSTAYNFGTTPAFGWRPGAIPNPDLNWEKTHQYNFGLDFGVLNNRITGTVEVYRQDTKDLLLSRGLPAASGFTTVLQNVGQTRNSGIELAFSTVNIENWNGFRWTMDMNATHNKNEIIQLSSAGDQVGNVWFIGQPINGGGYSVFYDYVFDGIWQLDQAAEATSYNQKPGEIRVVDQNSDGRISATDDRVIIGNSYPDWIGSLSNRFTYGSLDLSLLATARLGYMFNDAFSAGNNVLAGRYNNLLVDYWLPDNPTNANPRPDQAREAPIYSSSRVYTKGDHYRIRNITLGYRVPDGLTERLGASTARLYATMQDPYVFTDYHGYDPENGTAGGTPSYWTLLIGTNWTF